MRCFSIWCDEQHEVREFYFFKVYHIGFDTALASTGIAAVGFSYAFSSDPVVPE